MSIAISTYATGSIASYQDLLAELRDLLDDEFYPQATIDRAMRKAEAWFNRDLRSPDMETRTVLGISAEVTALPADFLELRFIFQTGSPDRDLRSMSPHGLLATYRGISGCPEAYAIEGQSIRVAPVGNTSLDLTYYRRLSPISDAQASNWLLDKHPDLYVAGVLYYLSVRDRDSEGMATYGGQVSTLLESIKLATERGRWGAAPLQPKGMDQVWGARV